MWPRARAEGQIGAWNLLQHVLLDATISAEVFKRHQPQSRITCSACFVGVEPIVHRGIRVQKQHSHTNVALLRERSPIKCMAYFVSRVLTPARRYPLP